MAREICHVAVEVIASPRGALVIAIGRELGIVIEATARRARQQVVIRGWPTARGPGHPPLGTRCAASHEPDRRRFCEARWAELMWLCGLDVREPQTGRERRGQRQGEEERAHEHCEMARLTTGRISKFVSMKAPAYQIVYQVHKENKIAAFCCINKLRETVNVELCKACASPCLPKGCGSPW